MPKPSNDARVDETHTIYSGRIFRLDVERVTLPGGHVVDMELIRHPGSVVMLPQPSAHEVVLISQYRHAIRRWIWELPAGTLKPGEHPEAAAVRECEEEIGLVPSTVTHLATFYPTPGFCDETMAFYACGGLQPPAADSTVVKDADEEIEPRTFALDDALAMLARGEILDMKTAVGLQMLAARR